MALVEENSNGWRLVIVARSYSEFRHADPNGECETVRPPGSEPVEQLLDACVRFCGRRPNIVAVDMPLAREPITGRRVSDDEVSKYYGARKCGTHSPSALRPGKVGLDLQTGFESAGYHLRTCSAETGGLIEVYPHPALVELSGAPERLPYKAAKVRSYWPELSRDQRRSKLFTVWRKIVEGLEREIEGVKEALPEPRPDARGSELKAFEDQLDAIVCAWVGICALERRAVPHGDETSAIWIPGRAS